jgi:hypothetical protein
MGLEQGGWYVPQANICTDAMEGLAALASPA